MEDGLIKVVSPIDDTPASKAGIMATTSSPISTTKRAGPHPQPGRRENARAGQYQDQAEDHAQGPGQPDRRDAGARQHPCPLGARAMSRPTISAISASPPSTSRRPGPEERKSANLQNQIGDKLKGFVIDLRNNPGGLLEERHGFRQLPRARRDRFEPAAATPRKPNAAPRIRAT